MSHDGEYRFVRHDRVAEFEAQGWRVDASLEGTPHHKWSVIMKKDEIGIALSRQELADHVGQLISSERNESHGDPHKQFACQQLLLKVLESEEGFAWLNPSARHAVQMITTKLSRIVCGKNLQDHWLDCAGYALIAAERAEKPLTKE